MSKEVKQYIIIRTDLEMSVGKTAAQASHASMKVFFDKMEDTSICDSINENDGMILPVTEEEREWIKGRFTKIVLKVKNEHQLLKAYQSAQMLGLNCSLIQDAGLTELDGKNFTAVAIGPNYTEKCKPVVKRLQTL